MRRGDLAGGDANIDPISALSLCDRQVAILCEAEHRCCTDVGHKYASATACESALLPECENSLEDLYVASETGYDSTEAAAQIGALIELAAACDPAVTEWRTSRDGLFAVLKGTVGSGEDCSSTTLPSNDDGASFVPFASCQSPYVCRISAIVASPASVTGSCGTAAGLTDTCYTTAECAGDYTCFPPDNFTGGGGTCQTRKANGLGCVYDQNCISLNCGYDGKCAPTSINGAYCLKE